MLSDHHRMKAYYNAIMGNKDVFRDKVVMDVGSGSGILAVWAAQAGARRVYAVEYTDMANHARSVVKANGLDHIVTVIQGAVEDVTIPKEDWDLFRLQVEEDTFEECSEPSSCKQYSQQEQQQQQQNERVVDIIISEWMGYFLLRESMLDSVIRARELFLKPKSGMLLPSHATMFIAPINNSKHHHEVLTDYRKVMDDWHDYLVTAKEQYGVDMSVLEDQFDKEQLDYYLMSSHWVQLEDYETAVLAPPVVVKTLDLALCTLKDAKGVGVTEFAFDIASAEDEDDDGEEEHDEISGFGGWFDVDFQSRTDDIGKEFGAKILNPVHFTSSPEIGGKSSGQLNFMLQFRFLV